MRWRLVAQRVARRVRSTSSDATKPGKLRFRILEVPPESHPKPEDPPVQVCKPEGEKLHFRIVKVPSESHPQPEVPPVQGCKPGGPGLQPTSVPKKRRKIADNETILNILKDINVDLAFSAAEVEYAADSSDDSAGRDSMPKTSRGEAHYAERGSDLSGLEQLPLSPLMHPRLLEARRRFTKPKPLPSMELNAFQRRISLNPYAKALATPIRVCMLTGVRLPISFLLPFGLKKDPRTGKFWQIPTGLHNFEDQPMTSEADADGSVNRQEPTELSFFENKETLPISPEKEKQSQSPTYDEEPISPTNESSAPQGDDNFSLTPIRNVNSVDRVLQQPRVHRPTLSKAYLSNTQAVLAHVSLLRRPHFMRILPQRWKSQLGESLRTSVWRQDMADFVLTLLRTQVVSWLLSIRRLIPISDQQVAERGISGDVTAVLWFRDAWSEEEEQEKEKEPGKQRIKYVNEPPLGAVVRVGGLESLGWQERVDRQGSGMGRVSDGEKKLVEAVVPVFNLPLLLGKTGMAVLWRGKEAYYHRRKYGMLGLDQGKFSCRMVGMLWGLEQYVRNGEVEMREWVKR